MDKSRGLMGQLYGIPVYVSSNVVGALQTYRNILATPEAFGFAIQTQGSAVEGMQGPARVRVQAQYMLQNLGTLTVADIVYGVAALREAAAVLINANSTAITS